MRGINLFKSAVYIDLSENGIREIPSSSFAIAYDLDGGGVWKTGKMQFLACLRILDLSHNCLQSMGMMLHIICHYN